MADKLLVEIDMCNGDLDDAIPALIYLANELVEAGTIEISNPINWNEKQGHKYQVKWRFEEDEHSSWQIPLDVDFLLRLNQTLTQIRANITESEENAIALLQDQLQYHLQASRLDLFATI